MPTGMAITFVPSRRRSGTITTVPGTASGARSVASGRSLWAMTTWSKPLPAIVARPASTAPLRPEARAPQHLGAVLVGPRRDLVVVARDERRELAGGRDDTSGQPAGQVGAGEAVEDHREPPLGRGERLDRHQDGRLHRAIVGAAPTRAATGGSPASAPVACGGRDGHDDGDDRRDDRGPRRVVPRRRHDRRHDRAVGRVAAAGLARRRRRPLALPGRRGRRAPGRAVRRARLRDPCADARR